MPLRRKRTFSNSSESISAGNILNGVLDCKWNRTSATPSLLEIANTSEVKFNISQMTPLVLRFADGWDDIDQPKGVVKKITTPPPNIDLSAKANCHVQICAKVINDELVITTHDIYDPVVGYQSNILPTFVNADPVDGWSITPNDAWKVSNGDADSTYCVSSVGVLYITAPFAFPIAKIYVHSVQGNTSTRNILWQGKNIVTGLWENISETIGFASIYCDKNYVTFTQDVYKELRTSTNTGSGTSFGIVRIYEHPTAKYYRSLNKVKDRADVEQLWINLGYAKVDANGAITALNHYTDLRNNYPGGMRVEP